MRPIVLFILILLKFGSVTLSAKGKLDRLIQASSRVMFSTSAHPECDWHFVGQPFKGTKLSEWSENNNRTNPPNNTTIFGYTENDVSRGEYFGHLTEFYGWKIAPGCNGLKGLSYPANSVNPVTGGIRPEGYRMALSVSTFDTAGKKKLDVQGEILQHGIRFDYTHTTGTWNGGGFNLIANPYPCEIDWDSIRLDADNGGGFGALTEAYYVYNSALRDYADYNLGNSGIGRNGLTHLIPSMQSFFIKANTSSTLYFKEHHKPFNPSSGSLSFLREGNANTLTPDRLWLRIKSNPDEGSSKSVVQFRQGASTDFVQGEDGADLDGYINISTLSSDAVSCGLNSFPALTTDFQIPVRLLLSANASYTVTVDSLESFDPSARFFFEDKRSPFARRDTIQDLRDTNAYSFSYSGSSTPMVTRFELICQAPVAAKPAIPGTGSSLEAYLFPNPASSTVTVKLSGTRGRATYRIVSSTGQVALRGNATGKDFTVDVSRLAKGIYLIRVEEDGNSVTRRFVKE